MEYGARFYTRTVFKIEKFKDKNQALLQQVECLESENETLNRKVDWLYMKYMMVEEMISHTIILSVDLKTRKIITSTIKLRIGLGKPLCSS